MKIKKQQATGKEMTADYYDKVYSTSEVYAIKDIQRSPYYELWKKILKYANKNCKILDVGCGNGMFAELCLKNDRQYMCGIDFSTVAIEQAIERNPTIANKFFIGDIMSEDCFDNVDFDTIILCEVLEHLEKDMEFLKFIPRGTRVVFTVPNFDSPGHARYFDDMEAVVSRYKSVFMIKDKETINYAQGSQIYLLNCIKR